MRLFIIVIVIKRTTEQYNTADNQLILFKRRSKLRDIMYDYNYNAQYY
jgi:hypothetical protein